MTNVIAFLGQLSPEILAGKELAREYGNERTLPTFVLRAFAVDSQVSYGRFLQNAQGHYASFGH